MATQVPATNVNLQASADQQLEALRQKQSGFTQQLETNTTLAANTGRLGRADAMEAQKARAKQEAAAAGRPWTNADEKEWSDRSAQFQQRAENEMMLGREKTLGDSINAQIPTINSQIGQQLQQKNQQLEALRFGEQASQSRAALQAQQEYQQAMLKLQQQQLALDQSRQLQTQMYGPFGPSYGGASYGGYAAGGVGGAGSSPFVQQAGGGMGAVMTFGGNKGTGVQQGVGGNKSGVVQQGVSKG